MERTTDLRRAKALRNEHVKPSEELYPTILKCNWVRHHFDEWKHSMCAAVNAMIEDMANQRELRNSHFLKHCQYRLLELIRVTCNEPHFFIVSIKREDHSWILQIRQLAGPQFAPGSQNRSSNAKMSMVFPYFLPITESKLV